MTGRLQRLVRKADRLDLIIESLGRIESRQLARRTDPGLHAYEFRVYSQAGEDGIIQHLLRHVAVPRKVFVEFGVELYTEANTRFLLTSENWSGLVMDGSAANIEYIRREPTYWRWPLKAVTAFITAENINSLLEQNGVVGEIGLLSIDIDGNDYWVFEAINVIRPAIVVIEYNARFGPDRAVTIPYDPHFVRSQAHPSTLYFGASLRALHLLARRKGYSFVGCNSFGSNAFFVRDDLLVEPLRAQSVEEGYVAAQFREGRDATGARLFADPADEERVLADLPVVVID